MIVKNERHVILGTLRNVLPYISYWVIVDTGSDDTDATCQMIEFFFRLHKIPGELHHRPWKNFGHNRTEALQLAVNAPCSHLFIHDADDRIQGTIPLPAQLTADCYQLLMSQGNWIYQRKLIVRKNRPEGLQFFFERRLHEFITSKQQFSTAIVTGNYSVESRRLGARGLNPRKFDIDIGLLMEDYHDNPLDARTVFYLADTYRSAWRWAEAIPWYQKRSRMIGFVEETYLSYYNIALGTHHLKGDAAWPEVEQLYLAAHTARPIRAEPLARIADYYQRKQNWPVCFGFAKWGADIPLPADTFLVDKPDYDYNLPYLAGLAAERMNQRAVAISYYRRCRPIGMQQAQLSEALQRVGGK